MTTRLPSGLNAALHTLPVWPFEHGCDRSWPAAEVPDPRRVVSGRRDDAFAVGAEAHAVDRLSMPLKGQGLLSGVCVPHLTSPARGFWSLSYAPLPEARRLPSGLKHTLKTELVCPLRVRACWPVCHVPDLHRPVLAPRGEAFAVGAEAHAADRISMPFEGEGLLTGLRIPRPSPSGPNSRRRCVCRRG